MSKTRITSIRSAGPFDQTVTVEGGTGSYRKSPCPGCPWVVDNDGSFPAEAFVHSAPTAYDMSSRLFGCHSSGIKKPATCAGFLLKGSDHNLAVRLALMQGRIDPRQITDASRELHENYASMAIANGVLHDAPEIQPCR